jgi:hypothetical protein
MERAYSNPPESKSENLNPPRSCRGFRTPLIFDLAFIERRMRQHKELQARMAEELAAGIIREVESAIMQTLVRNADCPIDEHQLLPLKEMRREEEIL